MTGQPSQAPGKRAGRRLVLAAGLIAGAVALVLALRGNGGPSPPPVGDDPPSRVDDDLPGPPRMLAAGRRLTLWWDGLPEEVRARSHAGTGESNVHPASYVGPEACKKCHPGNYHAWSTHPHRWMNAPAGPETVKGDFGGTAVSYQGGRATFERRGGTFVMRLERGPVKRTYRINQTIGVRFFQYYVGKQVEGPEPSGHHFYHKDHVLPFGYWLDQKEWVPVVHIGPERPDANRPDAFAPPDHGPHYAEYAVGCNYCHTTFALGDLFGRRPQQMGEYAPAALHWSLRGYLKTARPAELPSLSRLVREESGPRQNPMLGWEASRYAVTYGVSCEACHLGAREHVESGGKVLPRFFPSSPYLAVEDAGRAPPTGRTHDNVNWACARCHLGSRPAFAAGMSTWNSVEYSDAARGSCYSKLRCIDCHSPHRAIGPKWTVLAAREDAVCLKCHEQYRPDDRRLAHTHHPAGSAGARCLNCHMPRINEGLQDVVRTHMIYEPTRADMIEANHPNACNLCHTDRPIDWTLKYLKDWYGKTYDEGRIAAHYPDRAGPVGLGWLKSPNESVRMVGADALLRARDRSALPQLLGALDDPYLLNRQFAARGLQEMLGLRLAEHGYRFYQSPEERRGPLKALRVRCLGDKDGRR